MSHESTNESQDGLRSNTEKLLVSIPCLCQNVDSSLLMFLFPHQLLSAILDDMIPFGEKKKKEKERRIPALIFIKSTGIAFRKFRYCELVHPCFQHWLIILKFDSAAPLSFLLPFPFYISKLTVLLWEKAYISQVTSSLANKFLPHLSEETILHYIEVYQNNSSLNQIVAKMLLWPENSVLPWVDQL